MGEWLQRMAQLIRLFICGYRNKVRIEHLHILVITNMATAHNYEIVLRKLCHGFFCRLQ